MKTKYNLKQTAKNLAIAYVVVGSLYNAPMTGHRSSDLAMGYAPMTSLEQSFVKTISKIWWIRSKNRRNTINMATDKTAMYTGIGVMCVFLGIGGCRYLWYSKGPVDETKAKKEIKVQYLKLQTEMVEKGIITNRAQLNLSELEKL